MTVRYRSRGFSRRYRPVNTGYTSAQFTVLSSGGTPYLTARTALSSGGSSYTVPHDVLSSSGAAYTVN